MIKGVFLDKRETIIRIAETIQSLSDNSHIPIRFAIFDGKTKGSSMYSVREFGNMCLLNSLDKVIEYGEDTIDFNDGFITVTVPFNRLGSEVYGDLDTQVRTQVTTQVDTQVSTQVGMSEIKRIEEKILDYRSVPRSMMEIAEYLNLKNEKVQENMLFHFWKKAGWH